MNMKVCMRKGIILAGGSGSRLSPLTKGVCKQLLPVYDKPMIYYPLSILMLAGIQEVLIISTPNDTPILKRLLGDGLKFGLSISYAIQETSRGLADAFIIGETFLDGSPAALILGDNLIVGQDLTALLSRAMARTSGATIFGYRVNDPSAFGVVEFDLNKNIISIEEKPTSPKSDYIVPGIYFYDERVCEFSKSLTPSSRGELEITDLNTAYLNEKDLHLEILGRGTVWIDMGTHESLHKAAVYVDSIQSIQGCQIGNLEEIGLLHGWITRQDLSDRLKNDGDSSYNRYLIELLARPGY
jgi:glucose-1-phosphate thymidylyltransferase